MPPPSDFPDFSKISIFSKNAKNYIFINFWAPGMLNSYSAYRSGGKKWPQINFSSKLKISLFCQKSKKSRMDRFFAKNCYFINFWIPGWLNSHSAYRSGGKKWPQINFLSKLKITFFFKIQKIENGQFFC